VTDAKHTATPREEMALGRDGDRMLLSRGDLDNPIGRQRGNARGDVLCKAVAVAQLALVVEAKRVDGPGGGDDQVKACFSFIYLLIL